MANQNRKNSFILKSSPELVGLGYELFIDGVHYVARLLEIVLKDPAECSNAPFPPLA